MTTEPSLEPHTSVQSPIVKEVDNDVHNIAIEEKVVEEEAREEKPLEEEALKEEVVDHECQGCRKHCRNCHGQAGVDANQPPISPEDPRLLIGFKDHVAAHILRGQECGILKLYYHSSTLKKWTITNERLQERINQSEKEANEELIHGGVKFDWLREKFSNISDDDSNDRVDRCARAYLLYVLGSTLFVDKMGVRVRVCVSYLGVLEDLQNVSSYRFEAAGLAYLYWQLGHASNGDSKQLSGYNTMLEVRNRAFPSLRNGIDPNYTDDLPRARRWLSCREVTTDSTVRYRQLLDNLQPD
ncbi:hypothetical protein Vadar_011419 [Vaccinium darrowii]|uniref:Uncharacterized protein n=1 Tax=Vaccinium darrowii TaxID=229202 RepID=A0ACB7ZIZ3_9ERIC|nr:hypothetical protein Vadar_011419 [Vaccinium darrowii]